MWTGSAGATPELTSMTQGPLISGVTASPAARDEGILMKKTHHNLASKHHSQLWSEHIVNLDTFSNGHCHTYDPANSSFAGRRGQFYAMLGK